MTSSSPPESEVEALFLVQPAPQAGPSVRQALAELRSSRERYLASGGDEQLERVRGAMRILDRAHTIGKRS